MIVDFGRSAVRWFARLYVGVLAGLFLWAAVPLLFGWHAAVVHGGSMWPTLWPGDVVMTRSAEPWLDSIIVFEDPNRDGRLVIHRVIGHDDQLRLLTKGDANQDRDTQPVTNDNVIGVARLRVPFAGRPLLWVETRQWGALIGWMMLTLIALMAAQSPARSRHTPTTRQRSTHYDWALE